MKKIILLVTFSTIFAVQSQAQYDKGDFLLNVGIGAGYYYAGPGSALPVLVSGEWLVTDKISVGPYLGLTSWNYGFYNHRYTFIDIGARGAYHFSELFGINNEKMDVYGGVFLGFTASSYSGPNVPGYNDSLYDSRIATGPFAGFRYFFAPKVAGYGELGYGITPLAIGLTFKF